MLQSGGELVLSSTLPSTPAATLYPSRGLNLTAMFSSYGAIYRKQLMVHALVLKLARATARLPLKVYERAERGRPEVPEHPYARLLARPNRKHGRKFFWLWTAATEEVYGEALWLKVRGADGKPKELWPLHPSNVVTRTNEDGELVYVSYARGLGTEPTFVIPEADVVHFKTYNPDTTTRGLSPLEPLRSTLVNEDAIRRASTAFWANGARPSAYLTHPDKMSPEALNRLKGQWDEIHAGVDNFGKTAILEEGMEPHLLPLNVDDTQYVESRQLNREEACIVYDVPPPVVHILDRATFSNITEQMRSMYRDTMAPRLGLREDTLESQLRPDFAGDNVYAEFLMDEVLRGSFEARAAAYQAADYMTLAEKRAAENLPYIEGTDRIFVNAATLPIEALPTRTTEPPATRSLTMASVRTVTDRASRRASLVEVDPGGLVAGLNGEASAVLDELERSRAADLSVPEFCGRLWALVKE